MRPPAEFRAALTPSQPVQRNAGHSIAYSRSGHDPQRRTPTWVLLGAPIRDQADLATVHKRLEFARIPILTVNEGRADGLLIGLRGLLGGMHLKDTRDEVIRGMEGIVRDGGNAGGRAYGYHPVLGRPGILEIVRAEAEVVCEICRLCLEEHGPKAIAGILNDRGVLPPRRTKWNASTINGIPKRGYGLLSNPRYDGRLVWNRVEMVRDPDTGRRVSRDEPAGEWMSAPVGHLRIVPAAPFAAVQERRAAQSGCRVDGRPVKRAVRPFSRLMRCSSCGRGMAVHDRRGDAIRIRCATGECPIFCGWGCWSVPSLEAWTMAIAPKLPDALLGAASGPRTRLG
jgi:hypothetical protein